METIIKRSDGTQLTSTLNPFAAEFRPRNCKPLDQDGKKSSIENCEKELQTSLKISTKSDAETTKPVSLEQPRDTQNIDNTEQELNKLNARQSLENIDIMEGKVMESQASDSILSDICQPLQIMESSTQSDSSSGKNCNDVVGDAHKCRATCKSVPQYFQVLKPLEDIGIKLPDINNMSKIHVIQNCTRAGVLKNINSHLIDTKIVSKNKLVKKVENTTSGNSAKNPVLSPVLSAQNSSYLGMNSMKTIRPQRMNIAAESAPPKTAKQNKSELKDNAPQRKPCKIVRTNAIKLCSSKINNQSTSETSTQLKSNVM